MAVTLLGMQLRLQSSLHHRQPVPQPPHPPRPTALQLSTLDRSTLLDTTTMSTATTLLRHRLSSQSECRHLPRCVPSNGHSSTTASKPVRFITAFPNGNTGALVYFVPADNQTLGAELNAATVTSVRQEFNQSGITGQLSLNGDATFGVTLSKFEVAGSRAYFSRGCPYSPRLCRVGWHRLPLDLQLHPWSIQ